MWSFSDSIKFLIKSINKFLRIFNGISAYSKDTLLEIKELFLKNDDIDTTNGINDIMIGYSISVWINILFNVATCVLSKFSGLGGLIIGSVIGFLISSLILQSMYNHRNSWNAIVTKILCALVIINIIFCVFGIVGNVFSFSIYGIIKLIKNIFLLLSYSLVLKGFLE